MLTVRINDRMIYRNTSLDLEKVQRTKYFPLWNAGGYSGQETKEYTETFLLMFVSMQQINCTMLNFICITHKVHVED